jgi:hypothetical protein
MLGRFFKTFFYKGQVEICFTPYVQVWKITRKKFLGQSTSIEEVMTFWVMHYTVRIRVKNLFTMWAAWVSKDAELYG